MKKSKKVGAPVYVTRKVLKTVRAELNELKAEYEDIPSARGGLQGLHINPIQDRIMQYFAQSREFIAAHGYMVQTVFATAESQDSQALHPYVRECKRFAYTIGRAESQKPDFVICDAPHQLINAVVRQFDLGQIFWPEGSDNSEPFTVENFRIRVSGDPPNQRGPGAAAAPPL